MVRKKINGYNHLYVIRTMALNSAGEEQATLKDFVAFVALSLGWIHLPEFPPVAQELQLFTNKWDNGDPEKSFSKLDSFFYGSYLPYCPVGLDTRYVLVFCGRRLYLQYSYFHDDILRYAMRKAGCHGPSTPARTRPSTPPRAMTSEDGANDDTPKAKRELDLTPKPRRNADKSPVQRQYKVSPKSNMNSLDDGGQPRLKRARVSE